MTLWRPIGRWLYGLLFAAVLPAGLVGWGWATADVVRLQPVESLWAGVALVTFGLALLLGGVYALTAYGRGLPMNPYPPSLFVTRGAYRYLTQPIYVGFAIACVGIAVAVGSASGLWLVSPIVGLSCAALVLGYERHDLRRRFPEAHLYRPRLSLPPADSSRPTGWHRWSIFVLVFLPWSAAFEAVYRLGIPAQAWEAYLPFERGWPVWQWTEPVYASVYVFVAGVPLVVKTSANLRRFAVVGLIATAVVTLIYLTIPVIAPPRDFVPQGIAGRMLEFERAMSHTVAAFPSFHVLWTLIAADALGREFPRFRIAVWGWATLITASCVTTGMHAVVDLAFAGILFVPLRSYDAVWSWIRRTAEHVANSWREWRIGPVRIINHGVFAGFGGAVGVWMAGWLSGPQQLGGVFLAAMLTLLGAGLGAQKLEGASGLARPFGFYGALVGGSIGCAVAGVLGFDWWLLFAAIAVASPWVQGIGRLRCLVQGCCHGTPAPPHVGIRYHQARSRVVTMTDWKGTPLHPTPVYSILTNMVTGVLLIRLWSLGASLGLITGSYFMLNGLARFVEESYRGEPQTIIAGGLRIYQWFAIMALLTGIMFTIVHPMASAPAPSHLVDGPTMLAALAFGIVATAVMGIDFPHSDRRFARLAPV